MKIMKNLTQKSLFFIAAMSFLNLSLSADDNPELSDREAAWEEAESSGANNNNVVGQQCQDYVNIEKKWKQGTNKKSNGSKYFVAIGISEIKSPVDSSNYITSSMNASINAQLDSKRKLVESMSTEITSEIVSQMVQQIKEGEKPTFIGTSGRSAKDLKNYEDMSIYEKTKVLVNQQLDKLVDPETKEGIANNTIEEKELEDKINNIVNQSTFKDSVTANASGSVRGMKTVFSAYSLGKGQKQTTVCNVAIWSSKLAADVDAMTSGDYSRLQNQKKGVPLVKNIPYYNKQYDKEIYRSGMKAFEALQGTFGAFMVRNEVGEMSVISYAQERIATDSAASEIIAFNNATLKARRAIIQLRDENIDLTQSINTQETTTEMDTGMIDYWSDNSSEQRVAASASGTLKGDYELYRWKNKHTFGGQPIAGIVMAWTPSDALMSGEAQDTFDYLESKGQSEGGSSAGDDEDDF